MMKIRLPCVKGAVAERLRENADYGLRNKMQN